MAAVPEKMHEFSQSFLLSIVMKAFGTLVCFGSAIVFIGWLYLQSQFKDVETVFKASTQNTEVNAVQGQRLNAAEVNTLKLEERTDERDLRDMETQKAISGIKQDTAIILTNMSHMVKQLDRLTGTGL